MSQNLDALIGRSDQGEYATGDSLTFIENGIPLTGEVLHCAAEQTSTVSGRRIPRLYAVDCHDGFPHMVTTRQIVQCKD